LVNSNNQELNERAGVSGQIFAAAGPQLEEACTKLGGCLPGEAKATRGFRLPAKHVIHTVPPQWTDQDDAEAVLEACYTRSFEVARKLASSTIMFTCIKTADAPREQAQLFPSLVPHAHCHRHTISLTPAARQMHRPPTGANAFSAACL
jgi:hypothetical protein